MNQDTEAHASCANRILVTQESIVGLTKSLGGVQILYRSLGEKRRGLLSLSDQPGHP